MEFSKMENLKMELSNKLTAGIILSIVLLFSFLFLGITGLRTIAGIALIFFLPFYLLLESFNLDLDAGEKIIFSFLLGLGIFPIPVYWLGAIISFRVSIALSFALLILFALALRFYRKKPLSLSQH